MTFVKGQSGNPKGRNSRPVEEKYLKQVVRTMPQKDWKQVLEKVKALALRGERWAVEFYADRILGKPTQAMDVTSNGETIHAVGFDADKV